ncbi:MAG: hypothetical protein WBA12_03465 [Catalinimonas sp.]
METLSLILLALTFGAGMMLVIGLIRPGFAVFWNAEKSRASALKVWGPIAFVAAMGFFLLSANRDDPRKRNESSDPTGAPSSSWVTPTPPALV